MTAVAQVARAASFMVVFSCQKAEELVSGWREYRRRQSSRGAACEQWTTAKPGEAPPVEIMSVQVEFLNGIVYV